MSEPARRDELTVRRVLREAVADVPPVADVDHLVRGGVARGRVRRQRRTLQSVLATAAVVALVVAALATAGGVAGSGDDNGGRPADGPGYASDSTSPTGTPSPSATRTEPPVSRPPRIKVRAEQIPALVTAVVPGGVREFRPAGGYIDLGTTQVAHFQLDGYLVSAGISPAEGDPLQRCREGYPARPSPCTELPDGSVLAHGTDGGPAGDGGVRNRGAGLFTPAFDIFVMSYNAAEAKDSPALSPEPPLSFAELDAIVSSSSWATEP